MIRIASLILLLSAATAVTSQESKWKPGEVPSIHFSQVCLARVSKDDAKKITLIEPVMEYQVKQRTVRKTRKESRQRTAIVNGKEVVQNYTVEIPIIVEENYTVAIPKSTKTRHIPLRKFQAWDVNEKKLTHEELAERLKRPRHFFKLTEPLSEKNRIGAYHASVLHPKTLFLFYQDKVR